MSEKQVDRVDTVDAAGRQTNQVLIQVPERVQFSVYQQMRLDALHMAVTFQVQTVRFSHSEDADGIKATVDMADAFYDFLMSDKGGV